MSNAILIFSNNNVMTYNGAIALSGCFKYSLAITILGVRDAKPFLVH